MDPSYPALHPCSSVPNLLWFFSDPEVSVQTSRASLVPLSLSPTRGAWESQQQGGPCWGDLERDLSHLLGHVKQGLG